ncbi:acid protease, partial [Glonium stellatum]
MSLNCGADSTNIPAPCIWPPSGTFDGNDGSWSTFAINLGDNGSNGTDAGTTGQNFKVHISTGGQMIWVPLEASWCDQPNPNACAAARGVQVFNGKQSLGFNTQQANPWTQVGLYSLLQTIITNLVNTPDSNPNGSYGLTNVGIGSDSATSPMFSILVAGIETKDFFMGTFGLSNSAFTVGNKPYSTWLTDYNGINSIPSLSYGYGAGAQYRNPSGVLGSLVLGGYDQSRCETGVNIPMPSSGNSSLIAGVQSILYKPDPAVDPNQYSLTSSGFLALIDSTLPYLWLPQSVCDQFASRFKLTWNSTSELYLVNDTAHTYNINQNPTISFTIGSTATGGTDVTSIVLPYAAFDLQMGFPIFTNSTRYFPIKPSSGPYVLGRAFLQEAYLIVNYENSTFTVAPATFSNPMPSPSLVPIYPNNHITPSSSPSPTSTNSSSSSSSLSGGVIAGIALGAISAILLICIIIGFCIWRYNRKRKALLKKYAIDTLAAGDQVKERRISELASSTPGSPPPRFSGNGQGGYFDPVTGTEKFPPAPIMEIAQELESPPLPVVQELESQQP